MRTGTKHTRDYSSDRLNEGSLDSSLLPWKKNILTVNFTYALWCICHLQDGALDNSLFAVSLTLAKVSPLKTWCSSTNCAALKPAFEALHQHETACICSAWSPYGHLGGCLHSYEQQLWVMCIVNKNNYGGCFDPACLLALAIGFSNENNRHILLQC